MADRTLVEQDRRRVKRRTRQGLVFGGFWRARQALAGYDAMAMIRKGQLRNVGGKDIKTQAQFIATPLNVTAAWNAN